MNNPAARFFVGLLVVLLVLNMIVNKWIHKELLSTEKPSSVSRANTIAPTPEPVLEYDMNSDYPSYPSAKGDDIVPVAPKPQRVPDKKIIYEMPTTNKFLLQ